MRTIKEQNIPQETDYDKFPDSTIKNETETEQGTPVVREIYGDLLTNIYAFLRERGINPNQLEDNQLNGYQLIQALKRNVNELNDEEKILSLDGLNWTISLDLSIIPDKYFQFVRVTENLNDTLVYQFKGSGVDLLPFVISSSFKTGDELLLIIDQSGVRYYNLSASSQQGLDSVFTVFGTPLAFNDSLDKIWYEEQGSFFNDLPESKNIQGIIRSFLSDATVLIYDSFSYKENIFCVSFSVSDLTYKLWKFSYSDLNAPVLINTVGFVFGSATNFEMHTYFDGEFLYFTNAANNNILDNLIYKCSLDSTSNSAALISQFSLDLSFLKSTNTVVNSNGFVSLINGVLKSFDFIGGIAILGNFNSFIGNIFKIKSNIYYSNGEVAKKWLINN